MRPVKLMAAMLIAAVLTACGGPRDDVTPPPPPTSKFSSLVSFGDSLSDMGTYSVGTVKELGGGKYTVNTPGARIWIELLAAQFGLSAPCPAQTGLEGDPGQGFFVPVTNFLLCTAYGQGGARVTDRIGPGNKLLGGPDAVLGELTVPVATQLQNHLATHGGRFTGSEIVFVLAGGNDVFMQLNAVAAGRHPLTATDAAGSTGRELVRLVRSMIGAGAQYVTVVNVPDIGISPFARAQTSGTQDLIDAMTKAFNAAVRHGLKDNPHVVLVDAYALSRDQFANPAQYGLTNTTTPACDLSPEKNPFQSSLICTPANVIPGVIDRYQFADAVHPTPYTHQLLATRVTDDLGSRGWLLKP